MLWHPQSRGKRKTLPAFFFRKQTFISLHANVLGENGDGLSRNIRDKCVGGA